MALGFPDLSWLLWSGKHQEPRILNSSSEGNLSEPDDLEFPLVKRATTVTSSRRVKRKRHSREERKVDREYDIVLVPSDGGCFSGSDSDGSDWSIGWLEPHGPDFQTDDEMNNSFAVLVPCYGKIPDDVLEKKEVISHIENVFDSHPDENMRYMVQKFYPLPNT